MYRPLASLPLPATVILELQKNGFYYYEDVIKSKGIVSEARNILHQYKLDEPNYWHTLIATTPSSSAYEIFQEESNSSRILTRCMKLDSILEGGIPVGFITELCGAPGSGKTQLCFQLCVNVQIPQQLGGLEGEAIFIDTASNFNTKRIRDIAKACSHYCLQPALKLRCLDKHSSLGPDKILSGVHFISVHGIVQLLAAIHILPKTIIAHPKVRLIIIDSLAFPFNCGNSDSTMNRTSYLYRILKDLQNLAIQKNLAVLITNQLTTRLGALASDGVAEVVPALGESFGHRVNQRILLGKLDDGYAAVLFKTITQQSHFKNARFQITKNGIEDTS